MGKAKGTSNTTSNRNNFLRQEFDKLKLLMTDLPRRKTSPIKTSEISKIFGDWSKLASNSTKKPYSEP